MLAISANHREEIDIFIYKTLIKIRILFGIPTGEKKNEQIFAKSIKLIKYVPTV